MADVGYAANANRDNAGSWETWTLEAIGEKKIAFKSFQKKYLAEENGEVHANSDVQYAWEIFPAISKGHNYYTVKSHDGKYLKAESTGELNADNFVGNNWEIFKIVKKAGF